MTQTKPQTKRKGARWIEINGQQWSWFRGKTVVEIRDPQGRSTRVPHALVDTTVETVCECCREPDGGEADITLPRGIGHYIRANLL